MYLLIKWSKKEGYTLQAVDTEKEELVILISEKLREKREKNKYFNYRFIRKLEDTATMWVNCIETSKGDEYYFVPFNTESVIEYM